MHKKGKSVNDPNKTLVYFMSDCFTIIEENLLLHLWLKQDSLLKSDFEVNGENVV